MQNVCTCIHWHVEAPGDPINRAFTVVYVVRITLSSDNFRFICEFLKESMSSLVFKRKLFTFKFFSASLSSASSHYLDMNGAPIPDTIFREAAKRGSYKQGDSTFYLLIESSADTGDIGALEKIFQQMKLQNRAFIEKNFILFFRACSKARSPHKAIELYNRMAEEFQCKQTVKSFNCVLNVIIQHGLYREALEFHDYVIYTKKNVSPNGLTFNLVIKACCRLGLVGRALDMFRDMTPLNCEPDAYTYCTLMDGLCKVDRLDDAMALLDEMHVEGCFPTAETFNVLINGLCRKGDLARAAKLVDNMLLKGCIPNVVTYNTLIHGLCNKGKLDKAVNLLAQMMSNNLIPSEVTYGTLISGLVKQGRAVDGIHVLTAMEERGQKTNEYAYSALISGLFKENNSKEALKLWEKMIEKGTKPNTVLYSALIDGLCREKRPYDAEQYLLQMIDNGCKPNAFTYGSLMRGFFEVGNSQKAITLWKELEEKDNVFCCSILIHGLCKDGKLRDALTVWKHMLAEGLSLDTVAYSSMIHGLCNAGLVNQGLNLFNEMLCQASNVKPDVVTYTILFSALCRQGQIYRAIDLLNTMLNQCCDPDSTSCKVFLTNLSEKLNPAQDGREFLEELVLRLQKHERILGACTVLEVMLQNSFCPKASTWEETVQKVCKPKKTLAAINKCWDQLFL